MKRPIVYLRTALRDIEAAVEWYEISQPGLGQSFKNAVEVVVHAAAEHPRHFPILEGDIHIAQLQKFDMYCVYYRVRSGKLFVVSVYHQSRDPDGWKGR